MGDKKEYIERGALIEFVKQNTPHIDGDTTMQCVERAMKAAPAADVVEVRYGEWKLIETKGFCDGSFYSRFCCPLCLREIGVCHDYEKDAYYNAKAIYPYCHCGAKMDGD